MVEIPITSATVPSPLDCVISNANWQALVSLIQATFPEDASIFNSCNSEPAPSRRSYPWYRCNADGTPDKWYRYVMGAWISLHPLPPGAVMMYEGSEASITTFDGGEAGAVTSISGPMWEKVTQLNARFPVGPGTLPSTAVINVTDTGGEENHELIEEEIPEHTHLIADPEVGASSLTSPNQVLDNQVTDAGLLNYTLQGKTDEEATVGKTSPFGGDADGDTVGHNNLPPYYGIFFIRRTARTHYRV